MLRVAVLHYVFVTAAVYAVRTGTDVSGNLCHPTTCGIGAVCRPGKDQKGNPIPVCRCPSGYTGKPLTVCVLGLCDHNNECPDDQACSKDLICRNPCFDAGHSICADYAVCTVRQHIPKCACPRGYTGDPFHRCIFQERSPLVEGLLQTADYRNQGFTLWKGRWMIACTNRQSYAYSLQCCRDKNSTIFIPKTREDDLYLQQSESSLPAALSWQWYPINDIANEGQFTWADGTGVSPSDEARIPWRYNSAYAFNEGDSDCGVMHGGTVWFEPCSWDNAILCTLNEDL